MFIFFKMNSVKSKEQSSHKNQTKNEEDQVNSTQFVAQVDRFSPWPSYFKIIFKLNY